ncbi:MAG: hypothetical protein JNM08_13385, partial [Rubrivivax sp.]|nr:hypothetical protein [Rubrivivax sp.]
VEREGLARGQGRLAPVYDMLPMRWRPDPVQGGVADYAPFEPDAAAAAGPARPVAARFWQALQAEAGVSEALRRVAAHMADRLT